MRKDIKMKSALELFGEITTHLVSLTTYNDYGIGNKSRNIATYDDLAEELNEENIKSLRNTDWTGNSVKCFLYRCRRDYSKETLAEHCPLDLIGVRHDEFLIGKATSKKRAGKLKCKIK